MSVRTPRFSEETRLFNPGFLAVIVWSAAAGFHETVQTGMPFLLAFVAVPAVLHKPTREGLPRTSKTSLAGWLEAYPIFRVGFADRARALAPYVREGILFGTIRGLIAISGGGRIVPSPRPRVLSSYLTEATDEVRDCVRKSAFLGKWFARAGSTTTIMALWGVKP